MKQTSPIVACKDSITSIRNFIKLGLHPGSFGVALILRDRALAHEKAHAILRGTEAVDEMVEWVEENIPSSMFRTVEEIDQWCIHRGLRDAPPNAQMHLYLMSDWWKPAQATA